MEWRPHIRVAGVRLSSTALATEPVYRWCNQAQGCALGGQTSQRAQLAKGARPRETYSLSLCVRPTAANILLASVAGSYAPTALSAGLRVILTGLLSL